MFWEQREGLDMGVGRSSKGLLNEEFEKISRS